MKKSLISLAAVALVSLPAFAQSGGSGHEGGSAATEGKMLVANNGVRLGAVYRVTGDGSAQLIVDGKMVTVPVSTLSVVDGTLTTSLSKNEVRKLK